ncbi:hypothetical protein B0A48_18897 [Cryoendolithus antarcticus]|uniref:Uncharacterized protein n=1 Tax=Cryoendolithus antarcticus TaxID=1507870 RepID=A0A1V8S7L0_9PEZI|nr:hypothetical protein B0A48_18897 [Cryoendolithus antarcticus]
MPVAGNQSVQRSSSGGSDASSTGVVHSVLLEDGPNSSSSGSDGEWLASINPTVQDILRELQVLRRARQIDFRSLHGELQEQRTQTNERFDKVLQELQEQRTQTNQRFEQTNERFDKVLQELKEQRTQTKHIRSELQSLKEDTKAQQANRGATRIHNSIQPVGRYDATKDLISMPDQFPVRVHEFLRLKLRMNWKVLASLLRFYDAKSWFDWGLISYDESSEEILAPRHRTLDEAVEFAPGHALQELAIHIGLDYDKIMTNHAEDEKVQQHRATYAKRLLPEGSRPAKREKQTEAAVQERQQIARVETPQPKDTSPAPSSERIGWDGRDTEDRTPSSGNFRARDAAGKRRTLSPTSVATSPNAQLPIRKNLRTKESS